MALQNVPMQLPLQSTDLEELIIVDYLPFWFLSSRAKGPRGGCYVRSGGSSVRASFDPFTSRICVLTEKVSGPAGHFFPAASRKPVTKTWRSQKLTTFFGHLTCWRPFWARTFGPEIVTIVTWPKVDQLFCPFAAGIAILSLNFWSGNCHDRDMTKLWPTGPEMSRSWHDQSWVILRSWLPDLLYILTKNYW